MDINEISRIIVESLQLYIELILRHFVLLLQLPLAASPATQAQRSANR